MEKIELILRASLKRIVHKGLHTVKINDIVKEANVGIGTIYKYFKDKGDTVQRLWIFHKQEEFDLFVETSGPMETLGSDAGFYRKGSSDILYPIRTNLV